MRVPDRAWAESNDGRAGRSDRLTDRLARLPAGHPSADLAPGPNQDHQDPAGTDPADALLDDSQPAGANPDDPEPDDLAPDDLDTGPAGPGQGGHGPPTAASRSRGRAESATGDALSWNGRDPYRPWFSADGACDPWFAEPMDWTAP